MRLTIRWQEQIEAYLECAFDVQCQVDSFNAKESRGRLLCSMRHIELIPTHWLHEGQLVELLASHFGAINTVIYLKISGWGHYEPRNKMPSSELDLRLGQPIGTIESQHGIRQRGIASSDETSSMMAAHASRKALTMSGWEEGGFDVLIGACGVMEQPIPSTSILIQNALGLGKSGITAFDVNQTCLSFVAALDIASLGIAAGKWKRALIASADIASAGLDEKDSKVLSIFGDGAAALAVEAIPQSPNAPGILASRCESFGEGAQLATLRSGGTRLRVEEGYDALVEGGRFRMDAFGIFKAAAKRLPKLISAVLNDAGLTMEDIDLVICHQASAPGVAHVQKLFAPRSERVVNIFQETGNQIAASIPTVLSTSLSNGAAKQGDIVMLLGTAAGISASAMIIRI
jgi:3-oxoacyl-[acyl-carrier-protein] synthase-3